MPEYYADGDTYNPELDKERLKKQSERIFTLMVDGQWRTLAEISEITHATEASASARLRDFRKPRFGAHTVQRRRRDKGLFEYRLVIRIPNPFPEPVQMPLSLGLTPEINIPVSAAKEIADKYGVDQVVIIARKVDPNGREYVTTYGKDPNHCKIAAMMGDHLKYKVMGWEKEK